MQNLKIFFITLILSFAIQAPAEPTQPPIEIDGIDIAPVVAQMSKMVRTTAKPLKFYHWFGVGNIATSPFQNHREPSDRAGFEFAKGAAEKYWKLYGSPSNDVYGAGFYLAIDPLITQKYGGDRWVLAEVTLPANHRILDLTRFLLARATPRVNSILSHFECPTGETAWDLMYRGGSLRLPSKCQTLTEFISRKVLKISGFFYPYESTAFRSCNSTEPDSRAKAFVLTESDWINPENVRVYNSETKEDIETRAKIQTLFYLRALSTHSSSEALERARAYMIQKVQNEYPGHMICSFGGSCSSTCHLRVVLCSVQNFNPNSPSNLTLVNPFVPTEVLKEEVLQIPKAISQQELQRIDPKSAGLLWRDLEGHATNPSLEPWTRESLPGCSDGQFQ